MNSSWVIKPFADLGAQELYQLARLRQQVFVVEQNCVYLDLDNLDQGSRHMLYRQGDELQAYLRLLPPGLSYPQSAIGRVVVAPSARGRSLGRELVQRGIAHNFQTWPDHDIRIGAQSYLEDFYTSLGFVVDGEPYVEDGIPHLHMLLPNQGMQG